jgi:hypothetical protein
MSGGYGYIDAPCFSYVNEDCCMKSTMIRQSRSASFATTKSIRYHNDEVRQSGAP